MLTRGVGRGGHPPPKVTAPAASPGAGLWHVASVLSS